MLLWQILVPKVMYCTATAQCPLGVLQRRYSVLDLSVKQVRPPFPVRLKPTFPFTAVSLDCGE